MSPYGRKKPLFRGFLVASIYGCETEVSVRGPSAHFLLVGRKLSGKSAQLQVLLEPSVVSLGYRLWGVEYIAQGRSALLRVYIEHDDGIGVEDCAKVSHQVSGVLDVEDPIASEYRLEVSSPGMDRPLFALDQFAQAVGEIVKLKLRINYEGRRNFKGRLVGVENEDVVVLVDDHEYLFPVIDIEKANVVPSFE